MTTIYHLISQSQWDISKSKSHHETGSLTNEGFIHCSENIDQLIRVANRIYSDRSDMLALEVDTNLLTSPLIREASKSGEIYPHIYGLLNVEAIKNVLNLVINDGQFTDVKS
jgi:uncharacterized protein (DUF952 family)